MLARAPLLSSADVLVYAGGPATDAQRTHWRELVRMLPTRNSTIVFNAFNPGYQSGAKYAMAIALRSGWFSAYDWIVRLNPDVMVWDEATLTGFMYNKSASFDGVFANCGRKGCCGKKGGCPPYGPGCTAALMHSDFFAVRPTMVRQDDFSCWNTSGGDTGIPPGARSDDVFTPDPSDPCAKFMRGAAGHAEEQATRAFAPIVARRADAWLSASNPRMHCHIRAGGVYHMFEGTRRREHKHDRLLCDADCSAWTDRAAGAKWVRHRHPAGVVTEQIRSR